MKIKYNKEFWNKAKKKSRGSFFYFYLFQNHTKYVQTQLFRLIPKCPRQNTFYTVSSYTEFVLSGMRIFFSISYFVCYMYIFQDKYDKNEQRINKPMFPIQAEES